MKAQVIEMEPQLKIKSEATSILMKNLVKEKAQADEVRQIVVNDEAIVKVRKTTFPMSNIINFLILFFRMSICVGITKTGTTI